MGFLCTVVTPEKQAFEATITQAIVPAHDGLIGILTDRAPMLVKLGTGPLRVDLPGNQKQYFVIDGGVAQMKDNKLTIVTEFAQSATEIEYEQAQADYAEAVSQKPTDPRGAEKRQHDIMLARAKQGIAGR